MKEKQGRGNTPALLFYGEGVAPSGGWRRLLSELTKVVDADIIIGDRTYAVAKDYIDAKSLGLVEVNGFDQPEALYRALYWPC